MAMTGTNAPVKTFDGTTNASLSGPMSIRAIVCTTDSAGGATIYDSSSSALLFKFDTAGADTKVITFGDCGFHLPDGIKITSMTNAVVALYDV